MREMRALLKKQGDRGAMEIIWLIDLLSAVSERNQGAPKIIYGASILWKEHLTCCSFISFAGLQYIQRPLYKEICSCLNPLLLVSTVSCIGERKTDSGGKGVLWVFESLSETDRGGALSRVFFFFRENSPLTVPT